MVATSSVIVPPRRGIRDARRRLPTSAGGRVAHPAAATLDEWRQMLHTGSWRLRHTVRMPSRPRHPPARQRALALLANAGSEGVSEHLLMAAHGFSLMQLAGLVRAGLASATPQRVKAGREVIFIAVLRITEAGRKALAAKA